MLFRSWVVGDAGEAAAVLAQPLAPGVEWLAEQCIDFVQELSAQVARSPHGRSCSPKHHNTLAYVFGSRPSSA